MEGEMLPNEKGSRDFASADQFNFPWLLLVLEAFYFLLFTGPIILETFPTILPSPVLAWGCVSITFIDILVSLAAEGVRRDMEVIKTQIPRTIHTNCLTRFQSNKLIRALFCVSFSHVELRSHKHPPVSSTDIFLEFCNMGQGGPVKSYLYTVSLRPAHPQTS